MQNLEKDLKQNVLDFGLFSNSWDEGGLFYVSCVKIGLDARKRFVATVSYVIYSTLHQYNVVNVFKYAGLRLTIGIPTTMALRLLVKHKHSVINLDKQTQTNRQTIRHTFKRHTQTGRQTKIDKHSEISETKSVNINVFFNDFCSCHVLSFKNICQHFYYKKRVKIPNEKQFQQTVMTLSSIYWPKKWKPLNILLRNTEATCRDL